MKKITGFVCLTLILSNNIYSQQTESNNRFFKWLIHDPISIPKSIDEDFFPQLVLSTFSIASISTFDEQSSNYFQNEFNDSKFFAFANNFGDIKYVAPFSAAVFGASLFTSDSKFQDAAFTSFQSVLYTAITTNTFKYIFARSRPYQGDGAYDFDFFQGGENSFPSGHSSTAFALFTPWVMYYPGIITYSLMVIPTGTLIARIAKGKHWASDVTAGALIGAYWGIYLSKKHLNKNNSDIEVLPYIESGGGGFSIKASF